MVRNSVMELVSLAEQKTGEGRRILFENVTDLFLSETGRLSEQERVLMTDILTRLVATVEHEVRRGFAQFILDRNADVPEVLELLAKDDIEIARPLLQESRLLRDEILIEVIRQRTDEHRMAIALRDGVSEAVADVLIEYGNVDVIETLVRNPEAELSRHAVQYLVAESRRVDRFQEPLLDRAELPADLAFRMYWWVSAALRKRILTDFDIDPTLVDEGLQMATVKVLYESHEDDSAIGKAQKLAARLRERGELTHAFLLNSLRQQHILLFTAGIGMLAGLDFRTSWRIIRDEGGESFAVLARALDLDRGSFASIHLLLDVARGGGKVRKPAALNSALNLFESIDGGRANAVIKFWQRDAAYQGAIDELKKAGQGYAHAGQ